MAGPAIVSSPPGSGALRHRHFCARLGARSSRADDCEVGPNPSEKAGATAFQCDRKQKPRRAVKLPEIAHQAHPAGESIAPSYPVRHMIR